MSKSQRMRILEKLERGEISPDEAAERLGALQDGPATAKLSHEPQSPMEVLEAVDRGEIGADEAAARLQAAQAATGAQRRSRLRYRAQAADTRIRTAPKTDPDFGAFRQWWLLPLLAGLVVTAAGGLWMRDILTERGMGLLFLCAWAPLSVGLALLILGWASRDGTWVHVRVRNRGSSPRLIAISLPLPLGLAAWSIRTFGPHIDALNQTAIDEVLTALNDSARQGEPFYVKVDDGEGGEQVEVFIG